MTSYAELATTTNFSFLRGASHPEDFVTRAILLGHTGIGIADRNTLAGVVRAYGALQDLQREGLQSPQKTREGSNPGEYVWVVDDKAREWADFSEAIKARAQTFTLLAGARLVFMDGTPDIIAYPENRAGWARLCRLLTQGKLRSQKGECSLQREDLLSDCANLQLIVVPPPVLAGFETHLCAVAQASPKNVWLAASQHMKGDDRSVLQRLSGIAEASNVPLIAVNDALYDTPEQRPVQDILTCIREGLRIETAGRRLEANAERHLKSPKDMARLFRDFPSAIAATKNLLQRISFSLGDLKYEYPDEPVPQGWSPQAWLEHLTWQKARERYRDGLPEKVQRQVTEELELIAQLDYAPYFLTVYDIVRYAKEKDILCQGRGSAANSAVCYALGITSVDPDQHNLLFARFISSERREPPDIDVDFEHSRREEVIQYIYERYGREHGWSRP